MSQRLGMADGRCFTINNASQLYDNYVMSKNNIKFEDNYSFRKLLQEKGPAIFQNEQVTDCGKCDSTLDLSGVY